MILPVWVKPALAAVALSGAFSAGWTVNGWRMAAKAEKALIAQQKAFERQLAKQHDISAEYETGRETARVEYITREGQVREIYREIEVPSSCAAPPAVRGVLAEAVTSANASPGESGG